MNTVMDAKQLQIGTAKQQLQEIRDEGRRLMEELAVLTKQVKESDAQVAQCERELAKISNAMRIHLETKPDPANFPTDQELVDWESISQRLTAMQEQACARGQAAREKGAVRLRAIKLQATINKLKAARRNLETVVRGEQVAAGFKGGVAAVV